MDNFISIPEFGELFYHQIYLFYDEPLIFSCKNRAFQYYFVEQVPPGDADTKWIISPISIARLKKLESNSIEIRDIFTNPEMEYLILTEEKEDKITSKRIAPKELSDDFLPLPNEYLDFENDEDCELPTNNTNIIDLAEFERRDIIELSLEREDKHIHEISCNGLSDVLENVQQLLYTLAYKEGNLRGAIPKTIRKQCEICVTNMFAASVGIRFKSDDISDLFNETPLTCTLGDFNYLFSVADNADKLQNFLKRNNPRVAIKYRNLVNSLLSHKTAINLNNASPNKTFFQKHFSTKDLAQCLELINSKLSDIVETETFIGDLVGINTDRNTFEFISVSKEILRGSLSSSLYGKKFSIPDTVEAVIETRVSTNTISNEEKLNHTLISIVPIIEKKTTLSVNKSQP